MRRLVPPALFALGAAVALGLTACGGGEDAQLLPGSTAQQINENLGRVRQLADEGECVGAADAAQEVSNQIESLGGVDAKLKQALEQGSARLEEAVASCEETATEAAPPTEPSTEEVPSEASHRAEKEEEKREKEAEKLEKDEEKEAEKEEKEAEHETGPPEEATPPVPPTTPPGEGGGTGAPGGVGPNTPAGGGD